MKNFTKKLTLVALALVATSSIFPALSTVVSAVTSSAAADQAIASKISQLVASASKPANSISVDAALSTVGCVSNVLKKAVEIPFVVAGGCSPTFDLAVIKNIPNSSALSEWVRIFNHKATKRNVAIAAGVAAVATAAGVVYYIYTLPAATQAAPAALEVAAEATQVAAPAAEVVKQTMLERMKAATLAAYNNAKSMIPAMPSMPTVVVPSLADLQAKQEALAFAGTVVGTTVAAKLVDATVKAEAAGAQPEVKAEESSSYLPGCLEGDSCNRFYCGCGCA